MKISIRNLKSVCIYFGFIALTVTLGACGGASTPEAGTVSAAGTKNLPPVAVQLVELTSMSAGVVSASWMPALDDTTAATSIKYQLHASQAENFTPSAATLVQDLTGVTTASLSGKLEAGKKYFIRIIAIDAQGEQSVSDPLQVTVATIDSKPVVGVKVQTLDAQQVVAITSDRITLQSGTQAPAVGTYISSAEGTGFLRKVISIENRAGQTELVTVNASLNEVVSEISISSGFRMGVVPVQAAPASQAGLIVAKEGNTSKHVWPESGYRYEAYGAPQNAPSASAIPIVHQVGLLVGEPNTQTDDWAKFTTPAAIALKEENSDTQTLQAKIINQNIPFLWGSSRVGICKIEMTGITGKGDASDPTKLKVSIGSLDVVYADSAPDAYRIREVNAPIVVTAEKGSASPNPYKVSLRLTVDDIEDGCQGSAREVIEAVVDVFVSNDVLPSQEKQKVSLSTSANFSIDNEIETTFDPAVEIETTISSAQLKYAKFQATASPLIEQTLTIKATAAATLDKKTVKVIQPRKFYKVYMAGPVPVVISGVFTLEMDVEGQVSGELTATEKLTIGYDQIKFGVEYKNGVFVPIKSAEPVYKIRVSGEGKAQAELTVKLRPKLEITAYETVTGSLALEPYLIGRAGVEGHVVLDAAVDFQTGHLDRASDADYRLTKAEITSGLNAYLYAELQVFDTTLYAWPEKDKEEKVVLIAETPILGLPALSTTVDYAATYPGNTRAFVIKGEASNVPNPFKAIMPSSRDAFIEWASWTKSRIVAQLGISADSYQLLSSAEGKEAETWVVMTKPGSYRVRQGGYSSIGGWARQYTETTVDIVDENDNTMPDWWELRYRLVGSSGKAVAEADPDADGVKNLQEWEQGTDPTKADRTSCPDGQLIRDGFCTAPMTPLITALPSTGIVGQSIQFVLSNLESVAHEVLWWIDGTAQEVRQAIGRAEQTLSAAIDWVFEATGVHAVKADVYDSNGKVIQNANLDVSVGYGSVTAISPTAVTRTIATDFVLTGTGLPTTGLEATVPGDSKASCTVGAAQTNSVAVRCTIYALGEQLVDIKHNGVSLGGAAVQVQSNVTGVSWASASTTNSGTVKFGEQVIFTVHGVNLTADATMGFAVEKCGVSNTEVGSPGNTTRTFQCLFNNEAGAVAGQMEGVVKDAPSGQVLYGGAARNFLVAVEVPPQASISIKLPHTGITANQCYQAGSDTLVSCSSEGAIALSGAGKQDGMYANVNAMSYSEVPGYSREECVKDNVTGLMWEGKTASGLRAGSNVYTHYDVMYDTYESQIYAATNTYGYVKAVNDTALCGFGDWRLPTVDELQSIVDYSVPRDGLAINSVWFPNTQGSAYWTASPVAGGIRDGAYRWPANVDAWFVSFSDGQVSPSVSGRPSGFFVRLVRSSQ